jgi:hypothetical protein
MSTIAVDDLVLKEEADKKKLERTISLLSSRWKASNTERMIYQKVKMVIEVEKRVKVLTIVIHDRLWLGN